MHELRLPSDAAHIALEYSLELEIGAYYAL